MYRFVPILLAFFSTGLSYGTSSRQDEILKALSPSARVETAAQDERPYEIQVVERREALQPAPQTSSAQQMEQAKDQQQQQQQAKQQQEAKQQQQEAKEQKQQQQIKDQEQDQDVTQSTPPEWKQEQKRIQNGTFCATYRRQGYFGFDSRQSDDHMAVVIVGENPEEVEKTYQKEVNRLRTSFPDAFRMMRRIGKRTTILIQGRINSNENDAILAGRGEVSTSLDQMVRFLREPIIVQQRTTTSPRKEKESSGGKQP